MDKNKSCENCGKRDDCLTSTANWPCHNKSAWQPKEEDEVDDFT